MKGVSPIIAATIIIAITISVIYLTINMGQPAVDKTKEILVIQEGKSILLDIRDAVNSVVAEGNMSTRILDFRVLGGNLIIDENNDAVTFSMESREQIVGIGVSKLEDGINVTGTAGKVHLNLTFDSIDILGSGDMGKGNRKITIRNQGYDTGTLKQIVSIG